MPSRGLALPHCAREGLVREVMAQLRLSTRGLANASRMSSLAFLLLLGFLLRVGHLPTNKAPKQKVASAIVWQSPP